MWSCAPQLRDILVRAAQDNTLTFPACEGEAFFLEKPGVFRERLHQLFVLDSGAVQPFLDGLEQCLMHESETKSLLVPLQSVSR